MASYGALLLRLILGVVYIMHAYLALVVFGPSGMIAYQAKNGVPFPELATWCLILAHVLGAIVFVHLKKGFWAHEGGYEYVLVLLVATVAAAMIGGGALSLKR